MGIEPTQSAWKAEVLPLNYTRLCAYLSLDNEITFGYPSDRSFFVCWWRGKDSNLRRQSRQIYSLIPLTAREPLHKERYSLPCSQPSQDFLTIIFVRLILLHTNT